MARVVVGLSGGVDSSVAAYVLKEQGHEVIGMFMQNWHDTTGVIEGDCPWADDLLLARMVAKHLNIEFHHVDLSEKYKERVVDYLFNEYEQGRTPNPDVLCNREVKFDIFAKEAFKLNAEFVATGHYCQKDETIVNGKTYYKLIAGADNNKDQSYFLCQLSQEQLRTALFPIGHLEKPEVRKIAEEIDLPTATRKDSQGICFIGKVDLPVFLQQKLTAKKGMILELAAESMHKHTPDPYFGYDFTQIKGKKVGEHNGAHFYTIGQRKGLNVGGTPLPLFVLGIDVHSNIVYVGQGHDHPGLNRKGLKIKPEEIHWIRTDQQMNPGDSRDFLVRIRYRQPLQKASLHLKDDGLYIDFEEPQRGITSGQFAAWYDGNELMGSGVIQ